MTHPVRIQIYTMQTVEEALAVAAVGVDHVGVTPADLGLPGEVDLARAAEISEALRGAATSVALSVDADLQSIERMVRTVRPDVLHLCGAPGIVGPDAVADLRKSLPGVAIMQAIAVTGPEAVDEARSFEPVVDYLILDSVDAEIPGVGAAGVVHDWDMSAAIVAAVEVPVILAGGLAPENVADAIAAVNPWGVDSLTFTNRPTGDGGFCKDLERVGAFVAAARNAVSS
jgi:phosphoribosylanthranilate isomerase